MRGGVAGGADALGVAGRGLAPGGRVRAAAVRGVAAAVCGRRLPASWHAAVCAGGHGPWGRSRRLPAQRSVSGAAAVITGMTLVIAHIGGIPVEETVAGFGPVVAVAGGCCIATLRARWRRARGLDRVD